MLLGFGISITADIINFLIPSRPNQLYHLVTLIAFVAISIQNGIVWALISDIIFGEWKLVNDAAG